jgi:hypothetical protein
MRKPYRFWRHFAKFCETHETILQLVIRQLPAGASGCLRQVNRAMRAAVNRTVTTVACNLTGPRFEGELAESFPEADNLRINFSSSEHITHVDVSLFLEYILATSPALVSKVVALDLNLGLAATEDAVTASVASFLFRCV